MKVPTVFVCFSKSTILTMTVSWWILLLRGWSATRVCFFTFFYVWFKFLHRASFYLKEAQSMGCSVFSPSKRIWVSDVNGETICTFWVKPCKEIHFFYSTLFWNFVGETAFNTLFLMRYWSDIFCRLGKNNNIMLPKLQNGPSLRNLALSFYITKSILGRLHRDEGKEIFFTPNCRCLRFFRRKSVEGTVQRDGSGRN